MKKILVAGAGHGGLVAAALLAAQGYEVEVFEQKKRGELGHDWEDRFTFANLQRAANVREFPAGSWRVRGDCAFVSPSYDAKIVLTYDDAHAQKIMWRKTVLDLLLANAERNGVTLHFGTAVSGPLTEGERVCGLATAQGDVQGDLVIDAAGVFSPVRMGLPDGFGIEKTPKRGEVFYAWRTYYDRLPGYPDPELPFEVYLCHEGEQGLSWCCTNPDSVDILIGRIDPPSDEALERHVETFRQTHPWCGKTVVHGGTRGVIPVRRPLALMVADGYAAVGDSAFMTTPLNGMGIDLSIQAGELLAKTVVAFDGDCSAAALWNYNLGYHNLWGGEVAKNEGLKGALLNLDKDGVDFLFRRGIILREDLSGEGNNKTPKILLGKFVRGMHDPKILFAVLGGVSRGGKLCKALQSAPAVWNKDEVLKWQEKVASFAAAITRGA